MAAGATYDSIVQALATQIAGYIGRETNVSAYPDGSTVYPSITIHSDPSQVFDYWGTFGANGVATLFLRLKIEVDAGDVESKCIKIADYLSVGTGNSSSVIDAIHNDRSLGGVVGTNGVFCATAEWDNENDPAVAYISVQVLLNKQNAKV